MGLSPVRWSFTSGGICTGVLAALLVAGCSRGEGSIVVAFGSELKAPDELDSIEVRALRAGATAFSQSYRLPGDARLPGTLTFYDSDGKSLDDKLTVSVVARGQGGKVRVERTARLSFVDGKRKVLQIRLERACVGVMCANDQTCIEGACKAPDVDADSLPDYASDEIAFVTLPGPEGTPPKGGGGAGGGAGAGGSSGNTSAGGAAQAGGSAGMTATAGAGGAAGMGGATGSAAGTGGAAGAAGGSAGSAGSTAGSSIDASDLLSCAVAADGVYCWGYNRSRVTPSDFPRIHASATRVVGSEGVETVSVSDNHVCGVRAGKAVCWGANQSGQLGVSPSAPLGPIEHPTLSGIVDVRAAGAATCALLATGEVWCLGDNSMGQLGQGTNDPSGPTPVKVLLPDGDPARALRARDMICSLHESGKVRCWGAGLTSPVQVDALGDAVALSVSADGPKAHVVRKGGVLSKITKSASSLALTDEDAPGPVRAVTSWDAPCIVLETGETLCREQSGWSPVAGTGAAAVEIATGTGPHSSTVARCVRRADLTVACWGNNGVGQVGNGKPEDRPSPTTVPGINLGFVSTSYGLVTAVDTLGQMVIWGGTSSDGSITTLDPGSAKLKLMRLAGNAGYRYGLLADGTPTHAKGLSAGFLVDQGPGFLDAFLGAAPQGGYALGIRGTKIYGYAESDGVYAALGNGGVAVAAGDIVTHDLAPESPVGMTLFDDTTKTACVWTDQNKLYCWGDNLDEQLGPVGDLLPSPTPIAAPGGEGVIHAAVCNGYTCIVTTSGAVHCSGLNDHGALGSGENLPSAPTSVAVPLPFAATGVACSKAVACAWKAGAPSGDSVACWGSNELYNLGIGSTAEGIHGPTVLALTDVASVAIETDFGCALRTNGEVLCWGASYFGQLGQGKTGQYTDAQQVVGLP